MSIVTTLESFEDTYIQMQNFILQNLLPVNTELVMNYIDGFVQNSLKMGTLSSIMLFISSLLFFQNYEYIANKIFHVKQRSFIKSVGVYLLMLTITPISLGSAFYITGYIATLMASNNLTSGINILPTIPYIIIWLLFFILFKLSANAKIDIKAAAISSFVISIIFGIAKNTFIYYVFLNQSYTTIYGSFAILLFLFLWIYFSWIIFIYGLKFCHIINKLYR